MPNYTEFQPNWASLPGETILDILKAKEMSLHAFAQKMNTTTENIRRLLHGYISITEDIAIQLERVVGATSDFWLNRESQYRQAVERLKQNAEEKWVSELPTKDMLRLGWIKDSKNLIEQCLRFFDVPDVWAWKQEYSQVAALTAFRKSSASESRLGAIAAWLRQAELISQSIECGKLDLQKFKASLGIIRLLTKKKEPKDFIPELKDICSSCGIALVILRTPVGCPASGATKLLSESKAMIVLSFRFLSDDQFWFTFFHEAGHLILHSDKELFIEEEDTKSIEEDEANAFAEEILIPRPFQDRLRTMRPSQLEVKSLAKDADISLGIVVGQLQYLNRLDRRYLNGFKRRYKIEDILAITP